MYGIVSLLCALVPGIVLVFVVYVLPHIVDGHGMGMVMMGCFVLLLHALCIPCVIVGVVLGIQGLKTERWYYARTGLVINSLWGLLILLLYVSFGV